MREHETVGVVGLGKMGRPMAERLVDNGYDVIVFSRSTGPIDAVVGRGARAARSAAEVASTAAYVLTVLPTLDAVAHVYDELAGAAHEGQVFVDHSTVSPALDQHCARLVGARGASFLDAPVSGGPDGAEAGTLTVMVGGEPETYERTLPIFQTFGTTIRRCGPVGAGQAVKLVNQLLVAIHTSAIAEGAALGQALGVEHDAILELIGTSFGRSAMLSRNVPRFATRDFTAATSCRLIAKDLGIIHDEARAARVPLPFGALAEQTFVAALARGMGDDDMAGVIRLWEHSADH